jgi:elongation factor 1-gamma
MTDYESYEWRKLNPDDENDRKLVNNFLLWEGEVGGKKFNCGKIFK